MSPIRILTFFMIIIIAGSANAQIGGYTCTNTYLDCGDVVETVSDTIQLHNFSGLPGDTIWLPVSLSTVSDTVEAFIILIEWDDTYLQPLFLPGDSICLEFELVGDFALVADEFLVQLSQNPADEGAIAAFFNLSIGPWPVLLPGDHGVIFRLPFIVDPATPVGTIVEFGFYEVNEFSVLDSTLMEAFCADCRRTNMAIKYDCEVMESDTISIDPLVIVPVADTQSCSAVSYPTTVGGTFSIIELDPIGDIYLHHVTGLGPMGGIPNNVPGAVEFVFNYRNNNPDKIKGMANGFEISGTGGISWVGTYANHPAFPVENFDLVWSVNPFSWDGTGADTVGFGGSIMLSSGLPAWWDNGAVVITIDANGARDGEMICIDSCFYPTAGNWMWVGVSSSEPPSWSGPHCFLIEEVQRQCPEFVVAPVSGGGDHCDVVVLEYTGTDPEGDPIYFSVIAGVGSMLGGTFSYAPTLADVGASVTSTIAIYNSFHSAGDCSHVVLTMTFTNEAPVFLTGCGTSVPLCTGNSGSITLTGDVVDCDPATMSILSVSPTPVGTYSLIDGVLTFNSVEPGDGGIVYDFEIGISDGTDGNSCHVYFNMMGCEWFEVQIEKSHNSIQGIHEIVDITLNKGSQDMGGFDFMIAYDASALNFQAAIPGDLHTICGWEYFNYRFGPDGNCGSACPSGMLEVIAIAETNNGANHPTCLMTGPLPIVLFSLDFLVSNDRTLECQYVPIRFFWTNCTDNSIAYHPADNPLSAVQGVSRYVVDYDLIGHIEDPNTGFPTYTGVQSECLEGGDLDKPVPVQFIDFYNGGIDIVCADSIDARGDVNLNGTANEIADAVLFSNYFVTGMSVFNVNYDGQVAATDVNADGLSLSVADLVYLIRIITGDASPYPKLSPVFAQYSFDDGILSVDRRMGAAFVILEGDVTPTLLAENMEMSYAFDGRNTHVLVSKIEQGAGFEGDFLSFDASVVSVEFATYDGTPVVFKTLPEQFGLFQNYPNPFNPLTTIAFGLPHGGDYCLTIFNMTGQRVASFEGSAEAGSVSIDWDASEMSSGVYLYKLDTEGFTDTKKMVLLK